MQASVSMEQAIGKGIQDFASHYVAHDTLVDGSEIVIRAIRPDDKPLLQEGMHHLSSESLYFRFFGHKRELSDGELKYFTELDFVHHVGLAAFLEDKGREIPVGVARYIMSDDTKLTDSAELAFAVDEQYQGRGIGKLLMKHLTIIAHEEGLKKFTARVMADNVKMLAVFETCGLPKTKTYDELGILDITLELTT
jgi:RimJ/RimL family protein N-acetyltransferase